MVMDASPSPQSVGREFVRQYYTLLNKAPNHLHRFYNHQSSFVHGGLEANNRDASLVIGQKQIHNRIQQLNFRDCHAKISQVDSQATLGNGVVVQVTGELSNDGQPMRRFTQTFVLAAENPKKYYVHNDIFRYQDVYSDDEADADSERSEDAEKEAPVQPQPIYYPLATQATIAPVMNGVMHDEIPLPEPMEPIPVPEVLEVVEKAKVVVEEPPKEVKEEPQEETPRAETTYANLVKSGGGPPLSFAAAPLLPQPARHASPPLPKYENTGYQAMPPRPVAPRPRERRSSNTNQGAYSDMQQLFLGNIPLQATEEDLRPLFSKYGTVLELRILSKSANAVKIVGRAPPPNYGFITFADPEAATICHQENNVVFPDGSPDGQKLNIELKKTRGRGEMGGSGDRDRRVMSGGGMAGNGARSNMNSGGPMGGGGGGGGGLRGSNNAGMMRPSGRSLGGNNGIRGNSYNRSDRMPMSRDGERPQVGGPLGGGGGGGGNAYGRR
uniref:Putative ras gtpase-activating protein-binding protein 2 n=1 Tax=Phlebotomus kandelakii TaxID=1109342 RepID=A0A6B2EEE4_9DIPT